jgi:hypothetical protein
VIRPLSFLCLGMDSFRSSGGSSQTLVWGVFLSGTSKTGYPIFIAKLPTKTNIMAHGPSQPAQALLRSKPKLKDKRSSPPTLLCFVRPLSVSFDPCDVIQALEPYDIIKALDPFAQLPLRLTPYCNTLVRACTAPYFFLLRNRSLPRHAGLPGNL